MGVEEGAGHAAGKHELIHPLGQIGQDLNLGGDLGAAGDRHHRSRRMLERPVERPDLGHHQQAGIRRQKVGDGLDRGMRAVRRGKGVVDIDVAERGKLCARSLDRSSLSPSW